MASDQKLKNKVNKKRFFKIPKMATWIFPRRIWFGESKTIYLTFDDGPHPTITPWLLDFLRQEKVKVNFFWTGKNIEKYPELVKLAEEEGHVVGHHGYDHLSGKKLFIEEFKSNFDKSKVLVNSDLFRPPYGKIKELQAKYVLDNGRLVMWSWMSYDYDKQLSVEAILKKAKQQIRGGDILVFHENDKTVERIEKLIPAIIEIIQKKGLNFAVIE